MIYEWDPQKARINIRKHGVTFEEALTVFRDPLAMTFPDPDHSEEEFREITIGNSVSRWLVFVSHAKRGEHTRIIEARKTTRRERKQYEESTGKDNR